MVAVLVILVIDFFDNTVKNSDELGDIYQKPIVGEIMNIGGKTSKRMKVLLLTEKTASVQ